MKRRSEAPLSTASEGDPLADFGFPILARIAAEFGERGQSPLLAGWLERADPILERLAQEGPVPARKAAGQVRSALHQAAALFIANQSTGAPRSPD